MNPSLDIPHDVYEAARTLELFFGRHGIKFWRFMGVASRAQADRVGQRLRNIELEKAAEIEAAQEEIRALKIELCYEQSCNRDYLRPMKEARREILFWQSRAETLTKILADREKLLYVPAVIVPIGQTPFPDKS